MEGSSKSLETVPGPQATYTDQASFGIVAGRTHVEISPKYGGEFSATNNVIHLEIPSQAYMDPREFYISFRTSIYPGTGSNLQWFNTGANWGFANWDGTQPNSLPPRYEWRQVKAAGGAQRDALKRVQFKPGIQSIIRRLVVKAGSVVLEDIQEYNVLYRMLLESTSNKQWRETHGFMNEGVYDPEDFEQREMNYAFHTARPSAVSATTITHGSGTGHTYCIRPLIGLLDADKYIPLKYMGQLTIEIHLASNSEALWSSSSVDDAPVAARNSYGHVGGKLTSGPNMQLATTVENHHARFSTADIDVDFPNAHYTVNDVRMHVPFVYPLENYDQAMMRQIEAGDLAIFHTSWSHHNRQISSPSRVTLNFQERALSLKGALAVMRNSQAIDNIAHDMTFPANGVEYYQWKIGSEYIPAQPVYCTEGSGRALAEVRKALGMYAEDDTTTMIRDHTFLPSPLPSQLETWQFDEIRRGSSLPSNFIIALDLEKAPGQMSGFDSSASSVDVELTVNLRTHASIVGINPLTGNRKDYGALSYANWQPVKRRVNAQLMQSSEAAYADNLTRGVIGPVLTFTQSGTDNHGDLIAGGAAGAAGAPNRAKSQYLHDGVPHGMVHDDSLTIDMSADAKNETQYAGLTPAMVSQGNVGAYTRVYFFAHIDQVLRLTAVGRMEIVR